MTPKFKQAGLVLVGVLTGVLLSLNFSAVAQRESARLHADQRTLGKRER